MNPRTYDLLKVAAQIWIPALGTFIFTFTDVWGLSYGAQIVGSLTALDVFLGALLSYSSRVYHASDKAYQGDLVVDTSDPEKDSYSLNVSVPLDEIAGMDKISLRVMNAPESHAIS